VGPTAAESYKYWLTKLRAMRARFGVLTEATEAHHAGELDALWETMSPTERRNLEPWIAETKTVKKKKAPRTRKRRP